MFKKNTREERPIKIKQIDSVTIILLLYFTFRFFFNANYRILFDPILLIITFSIFYVLLRTNLSNHNQKSIIKIFYILSLTGIFQIIYSILQYYDITTTLFGYKFGGTFGNPGDLANFLALTYSITLGLLYIEKRKRRKILLGIILALHVFLIVISFARTAWLATIASSIFILAINLKTAPLWLKIKSTFVKKKWLVPLILLSAITVLGFGGWKIYELKSASANGRLFIWQLCIQLIGEKPLFGHGYESFISVLRQAQISYFTLHPHDLKNGMLAANTVFAFNDFLQFAVEYGILGGLLLLSPFILPFRKIKLKNNSDKKILSIIRGFFIALFVCSMFSYPLQNQTIVIFLVIFLAIYSSLVQHTIFQFSFSPRLKIPLLSVLILACLFLAHFNYKKIVDGLKWKKASNLLSTNPQKAAENYNSIYNFMRHDQSFISNYGSVFFKTGEYQKLVDYYEQYGYLNPSTDIFKMVGESYEKLEDYPKAEVYYRKASNLIPHLFVPRYKLFKLYLKMGEDEKALSEAEEISELKIKVYSDIVKNIKTEVNEYLFNLEQNNPQYETTSY